MHQVTKGFCSSRLQLDRIHDNMACLEAEHAAAVKRAHDMVDMANRAAELVALRSQQSVRHKSLDKFVH
jgi:hypothetical protein